MEIPPFRLAGTLTLPRGAAAVVAFAHGSGSSRFSPRNRMVAGALQERGLATLLFDLLTPDEGTDRARVFDVPLLADRLLLATRWLGEDDATQALRLGYFGASTGAAAARSLPRPAPTPRSARSCRAGDDPISRAPHSRRSAPRRS